MTSLQDKIYGREIATGVRKVRFGKSHEHMDSRADPQSQVVIGRGGVGNARKSVSSASTISSTSGTSTISSRFLDSLASRATTTGSERSMKTRRWSSASDSLTSVINITQEVADSDRYDLYTISSHSTSTNESGVLSDIPSFISEYTFKTSSNPSAKSRPSTMSSNPSRKSGQSDWLARIPRTYSSDSLPIAEAVEATLMIPPTQGSTLFRNPFGNHSSRSLAVYPTGRQSDLSPWDEPVEDSDNTSTGRQQPPGSRSPSRFKIFRKTGPRIDTRLTPPTAYASSSRFGQSNETINVHNASLSSPETPVLTRRLSNPLAQGLLFQVESLDDQ